MKKVVALLLSMALVLCYAQPIVMEKEINCGRTADVFAALHQSYEEKPIWLGVDEEGVNFVILANKKTGSWTIIQFTDKVACSLGAGVLHKLISPGLYVQSFKNSCPGKTAFIYT